MCAVHQASLRVPLAVSSKLFFYAWQHSVHERRRACMRSSVVRLAFRKVKFTIQLHEMPRKWMLRLDTNCIKLRWIIDVGNIQVLVNAVLSRQRASSPTYVIQNLSKAAKRLTLTSILSNWYHWHRHSAFRNRYGVFIPATPSKVCLW